MKGVYLSFERERNTLESKASWLISYNPQLNRNRMGLIPVNNCLITDIEAKNINSATDSLEYSIEFNGHPFSFEFSSSANWAEIISGKTKSILQAMLYNNQWPIDLDTYITPLLIPQIIRLADYPQGFESKMEYYLLKCYDNGGNEHKTLSFNLSKYLIAFAENPDEFSRIIDALEAKKFIVLAGPRKNISDFEETFKLTESSRSYIKELKSKIVNIDSLNLPGERRPSIYISFDSRDASFGKRMSEYFMNRGFTIYGDSGIGKQNEETYIRSLRKALHDEKLNYLLLIKSKLSDINAGFSSVVSMAVETHLTKRKQDKFIYVGFIDDSPYNSLPRLDDYRGQTYDLRIISNRDRLLMDMLTHWVRSTSINLDSPPNLEKQNRFLEWLQLQVKTTQLNPIIVTIHLLRNIFQTEGEFARCLVELKNSGALAFQLKVNENSRIKEYSIMLLKRTTDEISNIHIEHIDPISRRGEDKTYDFPRLPLKDDEVKWMRVLYDKFLKHETIERDPLFASMWGHFPADFYPNVIDRRLVVNGFQITLLGIWHIDPSSPLISKFDKLIVAIRDILAKGKAILTISSEEIRDHQPDLSDGDIILLARLLSDIGGYMDSYSRITLEPNDYRCTFHVQNQNIYPLYREYNGLENVLRNYFVKQAPRSDSQSEIYEDSEAEEKTEIIHSGEKIAFGTPIRIRDGEVDPVFGVKELATDMARIIKEMPNEQGKMIGIFGRWGRGKSYFIKELWAAINDKERTPSEYSFIRVDYHAWKYQDTPASWAYLYESLAMGYNPKPDRFWKVPGYWNYYIKLFKLNIERKGLVSIWKLILSVCAFVLFTIGLYELKKVYSLIGAPIAFSALAIFLSKVKDEYSTEATKLIKKYSHRHSFKETMGIQAEIQKELVSLLKAWIPSKKCGIKKIILTVEDIDRCTEDKIIQNIDALRIILEDPEISKRLVIITAIDERVLKRAIKSKYVKLIHLESKANTIASRKKLAALTNEYLDKLFLSGIKLGELSPEEKKDYFDVLTKNEREPDGPVVNETNTTSTSVKHPIPMENGSQQRDPIEEMYFETRPIEPLVKALMGIKKEDSPIKSHKLTKEEVKVLRESLMDWGDTTPRKIRIFYYRYLLAKNLLITRYFVLKRENVWQRESLCKAFIQYLIEFSEMHNPDNITKEKVKAREKILENVADERLSKFGVTNADYCELLSILELVIAY